AADVETLHAMGRTHVTAAKLEPGDVGEDEAASLVAHAAAGANLTDAAAFTGRCNLIAASAGVVVVERERLDALNEIDEAVTLACLPPYDLVEPRQMVATVKIVPFAAPRDVVERCVDIATEGEKLIRVAALRPRQFALVQTYLPGIK